MPVSRIETLSQGYFLGKVADNNNKKIARKLFCGEIQIDMDRYRQKQRNKLPLPVMTDFGEAAIENTVREMAEELVKRDISKRLMKEAHDRRTYPSTEELKPAVEKEFRRYTAEQIEDTIKRVTEEKCREKVDKMVQDNFERIKQDIWNIIVTENAKLPKPHDLSSLGAA